MSLCFSLLQPKTQTNNRRKKKPCCRFLLAGMLKLRLIDAALLSLVVF